MEHGSNLILSHLKHFGQTMHIGCNGKDPKTEAVIFEKPDFILSWDLDDRPDIKNQAIHAQRSIKDMMPKMF
eukprot:2980523-Ditylum_brightwellii.AAC.1